MASHMRTDDTPTTDRVVAQGDELGRHATNQVIDEGVHIEAQDVRSSRKYFYTPDKGKAARTRHSHHHHTNRSSRSRGDASSFMLPFLSMMASMWPMISGN